MAASTNAVCVLDQAEAQKAAGNESFKRGDWTAALKQYKAAYLVTHRIRSINETSSMYGSKVEAPIEQKDAVSWWCMLRTFSK
jgi:hypothetical protein